MIQPQNSLKKSYPTKIDQSITITSSNINEVIRSVLNFLFFHMIRFHKFKKAQKEYKAPKSTKKH